MAPEPCMSHLQKSRIRGSLILAKCRKRTHFIFSSLSGCHGRHRAWSWVFRSVLTTLTSKLAGRARSGRQ